ncbi:MAG: thioredoxin family protein [Legionella sp.]|nr:thioredoxin family protein [Legionella sp.]
MSRIESNMLPLGTIAPQFVLKDVISGELIKLMDKHQYTATVLMFICNHCPYVKHVNSQLTLLANEYIPKEIRFLAISSNDVENYPADSPQNMKIVAKELDYPFPYLYDETQEVAKAYNAACTPDFYIFDTSLSLVYRGQLDDSRPGNNIPVTGNSIRMALDHLIQKEPIEFEQKPSIGCNIKWK